MGYKNTWGTPQSNIDQQRADLFYVALNYPSIIQVSGVSGSGGSTVWDQFITWTIEKFPFPEREVEAVAIKHGQQTNFQIGGDKEMGAIDISFRYAFNQRTAELLESWFWLISNPQTGGVGIASHVKTNGTFYWLVPDMNVQANVTNTAANQSIFVAGGAYYLEGVWLKKLKPSEASVTEGNKFVTLEGTLQIDRYYPINPANLTVTGAPGVAVSIFSSTTAAVVNGNDLATTF